MSKKDKETRIAGSCAGSTECSDHIHKILQKKIFKFLLRDVIIELIKLYKRVQK